MRGSCLNALITRRVDCFLKDHINVKLKINGEDLKKIGFTKRIKDVKDLCTKYDIYDNIMTFLLYSKSNGPRIKEFLSHNRPQANS